MMDYQDDPEVRRAQMMMMFGQSALQQQPSQVSSPWQGLAGIGQQLAGAYIGALGQRRLGQARQNAAYGQSPVVDALTERPHAPPMLPQGAAPPPMGIGRY